MRRWGVIALLVSGTALGAWVGRESVVRYWHAHIVPPAPVQTTIYGWQDGNGEWHYSTTRDDKRAQRIVIDTGRITPIKPPPVSAPAITTPDHKVMDLTAMREDLQRQQQIIQDARMQRAINE